MSELKKKKKITTTRTTLVKSTSACHNAIPVNSKQRASDFWLLPHFKTFNIQHKYRFFFFVKRLLQHNVNNNSYSYNVHNTNIITAQNSTYICSSVRMHVGNIFMCDYVRTTTDVQLIMTHLSASIE